MLRSAFTIQSPLELRGAIIPASSRSENDIGKPVFFQSEFQRELQCKSLCRQPEEGVHLPVAIHLPRCGNTCYDNCLS